ncbi:MAG: hypothetical protein ACSNEK_05090 [Parachlamydiaceae bacterium]
MTVDFWGHLFNPFSQETVQLTKKERRIAYLGWFVAPLFIIPGFLAFYGISYYFKNRALKNLTHQPTKQESSISQIAKNNIQGIPHRSVEDLETSNPIMENESIDESRVLEGNAGSVRQADGSPNLTNVFPDGVYPFDYSSLNRPETLREAAEMILLTPGFATPAGGPQNYYDKKTAKIRLKKFKEHLLFAEQFAVPPSIFLTQSLLQF